MVALILLNRISADAPSRRATLQTERFQTDNYTIRAAKGFNSIQVAYQLVWTKLSQAEANSLGDLFDATFGVTLIQWTPPYEDTEQDFTVQSYDVQLLDSAGADFTYLVLATLIKEYDL